MRKGLIYKTAVFVIALLILLTYTPSVTISGKSNTLASEQPDDTVKISVDFPGLKGVKNYTIRITTEKYEELCRVFNNTMKALQNAETEREACEIFNETILRLREIGIISPAIDITRLQKIVTGNYLRDTRWDRMLKIMEKLNLTEKSDNVLCLVCGAASNTFKMDFSNRIYDILVRMPSFLIALTLYMVAEITSESESPILFSLSTLSYALSIPFFMLFLIPLSGPVSLLGTICLGYEWSNVFVPFGHTHRYPSQGFLWTKGQKGTKIWNGKFYGNYSWGMLSLYFPLLCLSMLMEIVSESISSPCLKELFYLLSVLLLLYPAILYYPPLALLGDPYPGVLGFTGIYISVPLNFSGHYGSSFFLGHAICISIKEA